MKEKDKTVLDYKGFSEEEIQKLIDWKEECRKYDEMMWKIHAEDIMRKIICDSLGKKLIGKPTKSLDESKKERKKQPTKESKR